MLSVVLAVLLAQDSLVWVVDVLFLLCLIHVKTPGSTLMFIENRFLILCNYH